MDTLKGKKVLITGGCGFIGSHIVDRCIELGAKVAIVELAYKYRNTNARFLCCDISDMDELRKIFYLEEPEYIFHCAALARIQPSLKRAEDYIQANVIGTYNILSLAKEFKVKRVIYSASSSAYGDQKKDSLPTEENILIASHALHPYGSTKRMGEMLCQTFSICKNMIETVILRYFNVYGPRQATTADGPYASVIGVFLDQYKKRKPFTIVPDGMQKRDFTHVSDVVEANIKALFSSKVGKGEIINIGFGKNYSIFDVVALIKTDGNPKEEYVKLVEDRDYVLIEKRRGEVKETLANISKAGDLLGWEPKMSLEKGIEYLIRGESFKL